MPAALSDTQNRYLAMAWLCVDADPKIDYEKFSRLTGSKTAASAREMLRVTKKKLLEFDSASSATNGTVAPPNTPAVKTPRKKPTPKTKSTKGKAAKKRKVASDSDDSEDDDETPIKKKTIIKSEPVNEDSEAGAGADSDDAEV
ncbi:hypothetical protein E4T52_08778 [Aureobasidium sp. EXF-3400]|nr:hypothetical protein E4T51_07954 [Aureobasidium sp. EXF-12344]KAI4776281.1 hypothetical protein E4T52_08778 [Aureobasidium sp. EXF-3400]